MDEKARSMAAMDLANMAVALEKAVNVGFMSREHGAIVWKTFLKLTGLDIPKPTPIPVKLETKKK